MRTNFLAEIVLDIIKENKDRNGSNRFCSTEIKNELVQDANYGDPEQARLTLCPVFLKLFNSSVFL